MTKTKNISSFLDLSQEVMSSKSKRVCRRKELEANIMKKTSSIKSLKSRDKGNKVVRRRDGKGKVRLYVINKEKPRMKAKQ